MMEALEANPRFGISQGGGDILEDFEKIPLNLRALRESCLPLGGFGIPPNSTKPYGIFLRFSLLLLVFNNRISRSSFDVDGVGFGCFEVKTLR